MYLGRLEASVNILHKVRDEISSGLFQNLNFTLVRSFVIIDDRTFDLVRL